MASTRLVPRGRGECQAVGPDSGTSGTAELRRLRYCEITELRECGTETPDAETQVRVARSPRSSRLFPNKPPTRSRSARNGRHSLSQPPTSRRIDVSHTPP